LSGNNATGAVGALSVPLGSANAKGNVGAVGANVTIALTGVGASGLVGTVTMGTRTAQLVGFGATGTVGNLGVAYWSLIDDSQSPSWQIINDSQTTSWQNIDNSETAGWSLITTQ